MLGALYLLGDNGELAASEAEIYGDRHDHLVRLDQDDGPPLVLGFATAEEAALAVRRAGSGAHAVDLHDHAALLRLIEQTNAALWPRFRAVPWPGFTRAPGLTEAQHTVRSYQTSP
ncbi:hypothetical protein [Deinococcus ficus]|uniref:Uncharacterized protein n=1 Tax=Deinococcus ficus TaxID=317577 RepID=A0A221T3J9_9DEIO|nr:hypothetical protein [Deinococcus ficus]ASN83458.1 hypothetical protein DFI_19870 [Deinococcus ficus]